MSSHTAQPARGAAAVAAAMPTGEITLDVAAMASHDEKHRYELSVEGVLQVMSKPDDAGASGDHQSGHVLAVPAWLRA